LVCVQAGILLAAAGLAENDEDGALTIHDSLHDGTALAKFEQMCISQGVSADVFANEHSLLHALGLLDSNLNTTEVCATKSGYISDIDALSLATVSSELGAGRREINDVLDMAVGLLLDAHVGSHVEEGAGWVTVYHRGKLSNDHLDRIKNCLTITDNQVDARSRIIDIL
jgi:thymidine phosphorylase